MLKALLLLLLWVIVYSANPAQAAPNSFVSVVNPVRGGDFWDLPQQKPEEAVWGESEILKEKNVQATWLVRFDALTNPQIIQVIQNLPATHEQGLLFEITPTLTEAAGVKYRESAAWHMAGSVFLTGYEIQEREKLIDKAFSEFKDRLGFYPKVVGAWYLDSYSLNYMQKKYEIRGALIVADQYTTDNYQIWGQYWSTAFYPSLKNTLIPAQNRENKIPVVVMQWAARDPVNGYGDGVQESTYSVQANDYMDYHDLDTSYFSKLVEIYTGQKHNQFNHLVIGLENSYDWKKYQNEYRQQIDIVAQKQQTGEIKILTMGDFSDWYQGQFLEISPPQLITAGDPLGSGQQAVWFMNPYYRVGWFYNKDGSVIRDIRQYIDGETEPCFIVACTQLNFATFATRVLDDVTYGHKLILDQGKITGLNVYRYGEEFIISYYNEAGVLKELRFLPRDLKFDGKISTIDGVILQNVLSQTNPQKPITSEDPIKAAGYRDSAWSIIVKIGQFILFVFLALLVPGFILTRLIKTTSWLMNTFLSLCVGIVTLTFVAFIAGNLNMLWLTWLYLLLSLGYFLSCRSYHQLFARLSNIKPGKIDIALVLMVVSGIIFQSLAMIRSGWVYNFGLGFWGPTGHDGIWHQALINQLLQQVPPINPGFSGTTLTNYHYFYDLLVATTVSLSRLPVLDLLYRFYPVFFSLLLGVGTYLLTMRLFKEKLAALAALYFVYFSGSFGWIVEYLRERHWGGESAFWVNQPVSMNLNPPFAISLVLLVAILIICSLYFEKKKFTLIAILVLMVGTLIEYKVYAGIIVLGALLIFSIQQWLLNRDYSGFKLWVPSVLLSIVIFLPQNSRSADLLTISPFWFVHSMVDFTDRVGWLKLSQARQAYFARGEWLKFSLAEGLALLLFIFGNLGARVISILALLKNARTKLWQVPEYSLIFWVSVLSLIIPLIFIQKGNPWNTIQFFYYLLYFGAIFAGAVVWETYRFIAGKKIYLKLPMGLFLIFWLLITPINAVTTFRSGLSPQSPARLSFNEFEALNYLSSLPSGVILTYPYNNKLRATLPEPFPLYAYETTSYVAAFSGKPVFLEDEVQQEILQNDLKKRLVSSNDFFQGRNLEWSKKFLRDNQIRYLYLLKQQRLYVDIQKLGLEQIYDNGEVVIYRVLE